MLFFVDPCVKVFGKYYRDVLLSQKCFVATVDTFIFQQDNAPDHRTHETIQLLQRDDTRSLSLLICGRQTTQIEPGKLQTSEHHAEACIWDSRQERDKQWLSLSSEANCGWSWTVLSTQSLAMGWSYCELFVFERMGDISNIYCSTKDSSLRKLSLGPTETKCIHWCAIDKMSCLVTRKCVKFTLLFLQVE